MAEQLQLKICSPIHTSMHSPFGTETESSLVCTLHVDNIFFYILKLHILCQKLSPMSNNKQHGLFAQRSNIYQCRHLLNYLGLGSGRINIAPRGQQSSFLDVSEQLLILNFNHLFFSIYELVFSFCFSFMVKFGLKCIGFTKCTKIVGQNGCIQFGKMELFAQKLFEVDKKLKYK